MDPPRHKNLHALASKAFSMGMISRLEPWLYEQSRKLIDPFLQSGEMEFVSGVAVLPSLTIARLLGVPEENNQQIGKWVRALISDPAVIGMEIYLQSMKDMASFFMELIEERAQHPQEDLITGLLRAEIDGKKLERKEVWLSILLYLLEEQKPLRHWQYWQWILL
ncbi:hypothetical protein [Chryseobacterium sp. JUb7]|uniref:hypothetical protein n=1 Tax=Chryseobacterium sp. JUb7 TaxID=2940599 RepID=UPI002167E2CA|nr:hypothetical protein [Chryseobacterium sp. JUb7]MCS3532672.1 cytochrome P450 [Chryseobacterium sp. JUb7]